MKFRRCTILGAEVTGVNLCEPLSADAVGEIRAGLIEHRILVFREQPLTGEQLLDVGRSFGELFVQPVFRDRFQELLILENDAKRPPVLNTFHQDMTGLKEPPAEHLLHALEVPDGGGDTMWSCNYAAWESLSPVMQQFLDGLTATHSIEHAYGRNGAFERMPNGAELRTRIRQEHPPVHHPVVRTHPKSGRKGLFVNRFFTESIDGLKPVESEALLDYLFRLIETPEFCFRLRWEPGTLAVWDNRCTSHYAVADYYPKRRRMQRASVCGEVPV